MFQKLYDNLTNIMLFQNSSLRMGGWLVKFVGLCIGWAGYKIGNRVSENIAIFELDWLKKLLFSELWKIWNSVYIKQSGEGGAKMMSN